MNAAVSIDVPPVRRSRQENILGAARYQRIVDEKVGHGSYGQVYKARDRLTGQDVALKRMAADEGGLPAVLIREVATLRKLAGHDALVHLTDVYTSPHATEIFLVFELLPTDLKKTLSLLVQQSKHKIKPSPTLSRPLVPVARVKKWMWQLVTGVAYCHARGVMHRDIKPANVLVNADSDQLKLADFGLARSTSVPTRRYTHEVITLWYRPPEILLGSTHYTAAVDVWSLGCLFAECIVGRPPFNGSVEVEQLFKIFMQLGTPTEATWPGVEKLPDWSSTTFPAWPARGMSHFVGSALPVEGVQLLDAMLQVDPSKRISAARAAEHPFFAECREQVAAEELRTPAPLRYHHLDMPTTSSNVADPTVRSTTRSVAQTPDVPVPDMSVHPLDAFQAQEATGPSRRGRVHSTATSPGGKRRRTPSIDDSSSNAESDAEHEL